MPKMKTKSSAKKRFKVTAGGVIKHAKTGLRHILTKKANKRKDKLRQNGRVCASDTKAVKKMLKLL